jgi:hypothetical protein
LHTEPETATFVPKTPSHSMCSLQPETTGDPPALRNLQTAGRRTEVEGRGDYDRCDHKVTVRGYTNCGNETPPEDTQLSYEEKRQACEVLIE